MGSPVLAWETTSVCEAGFDLRYGAMFPNDGVAYGLIDAPLQRHDPSQHGLGLVDAHAPHRSLLNILRNPGGFSEDDVVGCGQVDCGGGDIDVHRHPVEYLVWHPTLKLVNNRLAPICRCLSVDHCAATRQRFLQNLEHLRMLGEDHHLAETLL